MSKIKAIDFANYVEDNRQRLIQHCIENGRNVSNTNNLYDIVTVNNDINDTQTFKVEFVDIDGTELAPTQYVKLGEKATLPNIIPSFDNEYLEFVRWRTSLDDSLDNVTRDIVVMPEYQVKYDEATGQRPTYLICYFDDNALSPAFYFGNYSTTNFKNAYIDYGDGVVEQITNTDMAHTYAKKGTYVIKIYGDDYRIGGHYRYGIFTILDNAYSLLKAYIGDNCKIQSKIFYKNYSLTYVILRQTLHDFNSDITDMFNGCNSLKSIILPKTMTLIPSSMFYNCVTLEYVILPNTIKIINSTAFVSCYNLKSNVIPDSIMTLSNAVYSQNCHLKNIKLPKSLIAMNSSCFSGCTNLESVIIQNNINILQTQTFYNCYNLKNVFLHDNITTLGKGCFNNCYSLKNITLPKNLTTIDDECFSQCHMLESITIPETVKYISTSNTFYNCYNLKNITLYKNFDMTLKIAYSPLNENCLIHIANMLKDNTNTDTNTKTITFSKEYVYSRANALIYLNANGEQVSKDTEGAMTLVEYIQNKNWTVTFA